MNGYIGNFRVPILWTLAVFLPTLAALGGGSLEIFHNGGYAGILRNASHKSYGWLTVALPGMAAFTVCLLFTGLLVVFLVLQSFAAVTRRRAFVIDADGVRGYNLFTGREKALAWGQIQSASLWRSNLSFRGFALGASVRLTVSMLGHKRARVAEAIAAYRPDLAEALR